MEINQLTEQIKAVAAARQKAQQAGEAKKEAFEKWEHANQALLDEVAVSQKVCGEAEAKLRELTLQAFAETGNKNPVKGVGIREIVKLEYDAKDAFAWAVEHKIMLKLDVPAFEKMSKMAPETRPGFVKIHTEPQATIATNLDEIIKEE